MPFARLVRVWERSGGRWEEAGGASHADTSHPVLRPRSRPSCAKLGVLNRASLRSYHSASCSPRLSSSSCVGATRVTGAGSGAAGGQSHARAALHAPSARHDHPPWERGVEQANEQRAVFAAAASHDRAAAGAAATASPPVRPHRCCPIGRFAAVPGLLPPTHSRRRRPWRRATFSSLCASATAPQHPNRHLAGPLPARRRLLRCSVKIIQYPLLSHGQLGRCADMPSSRHPS